MLRTFFNNSNKVFTREVIIVILLMMIQPFAVLQGDNTLSIPILVSIKLYLSLLLILILMLTCSNKLSLGSNNFMLVLCPFIYWIFRMLYSYGHANFFSIIDPILLSAFCLLCSSSKIKVFEAFRIVMFVISVFGIIACVLYLIGIPPLSIKDYYDTLSSAQYADYGFAYLVIDNFVFFRLCGLFNEPGLFATLAALVLIADKCRLNFINIMIFIACLFTFSVAFFALMAIYLLIRLIYSRSIWTKLLIIGIGVGMIFILSMEFEDDNVMYLFSRLQFEDGKLMGDSRVSSQLDYYWQILMGDSNKLWFGYGSYIGYTGSSSYKMLILNYGLFGVICIFTPFLFTVLKIAKKNMDSLALVAIFLVSMYQRPQIFNLAYFIILFGGLYAIKQEERNSVIVNQ